MRVVLMLCLNLALLLPLSGFAGGERLQAISFNTGLAQLFGTDLVPCVDARIAPQLREINKIMRPPFVLFLQEVWIESAQKGYADWAKRKGYSIAGISTATNGLLIVTSGKITTKTFTEFSKIERQTHVGVLEASISFGKNKLRALDTHTTFSGFDQVSEIHRQQLVEVIAEMQKDSRSAALLGGDLNVGPDLSFHKGAYDPSKKIWQELIVDKLASNWKWTGQSKTTWDETNNPLVSRPAAVLKLAGALDEKGSWGYSNSTLDHVFATQEFKVITAQPVFSAAVKVPGCESHEVLKGSGKAFLSDHYGWESILKF